MIYAHLWATKQKRDGHHWFVQTRHVKRYGYIQARTATAVRSTKITFWRTEKVKTMDARAMTITRIDAISCVGYVDVNA